VLFGHVYDITTELPLNDVLVTVFQGEIQKAQTYTNADGYYAIDGLAAGWYSARFSLDGYETYWAYEIHIVGGAETEVNALLTPTGEPTPARMYGHVRNLEEQPIVGAYVHLGHFEGDEYVIDYYAVSGQEGYYVIEGIVPGSYVIRVVKDGYQTLQDEIVFESGDNLLVNFNMQGLG
jgi:hypothetical protein